MAGVAITAAANSAADRSLSLVIQILRHLFEADTLGFTPEMRKTFGNLQGDRPHDISTTREDA